MSAYSFGDSTGQSPALRDVERWKDKIEVHLDNRQVFFLFFGSALVACLLFILGVIVGKRLESRGRAEAPAVADPLALLDQVSASPVGDAEQELTFPKALLGSTGPGKGGKPSLAPMKPAAPAPKPAPVAAAAPAAAAPAAAPATPASASSATASAAAKQPTPSASAGHSASAPAKPAPVTAVSGAGSKPAVAAASHAATKPATPAAAPAVKPAPASAMPVKVASTQPVPLPAAKPVAAVPSAAAAAAAKKYTLQLSSFQDRSEAEAYAKRFGSQGAYIITSEVRDKGTWYRVRIGAYSSSQEAMNAKASFEKKNNVIAYVALR